MSKVNEIIIDIIESSSTHKTYNEIEIEFANEIEMFNRNEINEEILYEIISTAIDNNNF